MGAKQSKFTEDLAKRMHALLSEDPAFLTHLSILQQKYREAMSEQGKLDSSQDKKSKDKDKDKDKTSPEEAIIKQLLAFLNDQAHFGARLAKAAQLANQPFKLSASEVETCTRRAAAMLLAQDVDVSKQEDGTPPKEDKYHKLSNTPLEELNASDLRRLVEWRLRSYTAADLKALILLAEKEQEDQEARALRVEKLRKEEEDSRRRFEEMQAQELDQFKLRLLQDEQAQRSWRLHMDKENKEREERDRRFQERLANDLLAGSERGAQWKSSFQNLLTIASPVARKIIDEHHIPYAAKALRPDKMGSNTYSVGPIQYRLMEDAAAWKDLLDADAFNRSPCMTMMVGGTEEASSSDPKIEVLLGVPLICSIHHRGMIVVARSMTSTKLQVPKGGGQPVQEGKKKFHPAQELYFDFLLEQVPPASKDSERAVLEAKFPNLETVLLSLLSAYGGLPAQPKSVAALALEAASQSADTPAPKPTVTPAPDEKFAKLLRSPELHRRLNMAFTTNNPRAHGLVLRCVYVYIAKHYDPREATKRFASLASTCLDGKIFTPHVRRSLFRILLSPVDQITDGSDEELNIAFYMKVHNPWAWPALLRAMQGSDLTIRLTALQDINTLLHNSVATAEGLVNSMGEYKKEAGDAKKENIDPSGRWQHYVFDLLTDLPRIHELEPAKSCFAFDVNILANVHQTSFLESPDAVHLLYESLKALHSFAGYTDESCAVACLMLSSLIFKLSANAAKFHSTISKPCWANLPRLLHLAKWFVFNTPYWSSIQYSLNPVAQITPTSPSSSKKPDLLRVRSTSSMEEASAPQLKMALLKARVTKPFRECYVRDDDIDCYGFHFNYSGLWGDMIVVDSVLALMKALRLPSFAPEQQPSMLPEEKELMSGLKAEYKLWEDAKSLGSMLSLRAIENGVFTRRKLGFFARRFIVPSALPVALTPFAIESSSKVVAAVVPFSSYVPGSTEKLSLTPNVLTSAEDRLQVITEATQCYVAIADKGEK